MDESTECLNQQSTQVNLNKMKLQWDDSSSSFESDSSFDNESPKEAKKTIAKPKPQENTKRNYDINFRFNENHDANSISMMLPKRRRLGLNRLNTNLKILIDDPKRRDGSEKDEDDEAVNDGIFQAHGCEHIYDKHSLFCFSSEYKIRQWIVWIIVWSWFDYFILACIIANSINLAMYDYSKEQSGASSTDRSVNDWLELIFTFIFIIEASLKIIGMGFITHKNSYMREGWNILDFIVVVVSFVEFIPNVPSLKSLRVLRVLRPLRSINAIPSMRMLVSTLFISIPQLGSVVIFLSFIFLLFGIIGINQYLGVTYNFCRTTEFPVNATYWPKVDPIKL